jgi:hypothetical protein
VTRSGLGVLERAPPLRSGERISGMTKTTDFAMTPDGKRAIAVVEPELPPIQESNVQVTSYLTSSTSCGDGCLHHGNKSCRLSFLIVASAKHLEHICDTFR